ncbi:MAG: Flp pilus assembly complex ATPase component TadA [Clostridia bacterium]|nr:Flp pilus assembly complex ATPase component TadA [Clostridia bacterium]
MNNTERFDTAADSLNEKLAFILHRLSDAEKNSIREIRCRVNKPVVAVTDGGIRFFSFSGKLRHLCDSTAISTDKDEIEEIFRRLCAYSVHSYKDAINSGFITVKGGHRAGVAGTAVTENGKIVSVRDISSINLRIAREIRGAADEVFAGLFSDRLKSVIIAGPPSSGKTTLLRDLCRQLAGGERGIYAKVAVCDERGEIGAAFMGCEQHEIGINSDLLTAYPKAQAVEIALRSFSPDIIILDEIVNENEVKAVKAGLNSGVNFILSVHARNEEELRMKKTVTELVSSGGFENIILLSGKNIGKTEKIIGAGDLLA